MKILLPTLGSAGDIHPFLAIGLAAKARGHEIEIMTNPIFEGLVKATGLSFYPIGTREHYLETFNSPKLWHPIDGLGVFWRRMACHAIEAVYQRIAVHAGQGKCVVMSTPLMVGARLANEVLKVPLVTAYTAATMLRSSQSPLTMAYWRVPHWLPGFVCDMAWRGLDKWKLDPMVAEQLSPMRKRLGLPPLNRSVFGQWIHSPQAGVTLFPAWFAPRPGDWPTQVKQAGFPLFDGDSRTGLDGDLAHFLDEGDAPIVFTPGSAMGHGHEFFRAAVCSCVELGRRGVLLTTDRSQIPDALPPGVIYQAYAPFGLLLPRAAALVHHGGIGTSAQALRAGIPQALTPMGFDQFDNAMRLELLGVGASLDRRDTHFVALTSLLRDLLGSKKVANACAEAANKFSNNCALDTICGVLESVQ